MPKPGEKLFRLPAKPFTVPAQHDLAVFFAVSDRTVRRWLVEANASGFDCGGPSRWRPRELARWVAVSSNVAPSGCRERKRLAESELLEARRDRLQLNLDRERAKAVDVDVIEVFVAGELQRLAGGLDGVAHEVAQHVPRERRSEVESIVEARIDRLLRNFDESTSTFRKSLAGEQTDGSNNEGNF
jgi:phage terminase Nu1 subunit (DNA packaging protein)